MSRGDGFDRAVDALGHKYRRRLLISLLEHNPQSDDDAQDAEKALGSHSSGMEAGQLLELQLVHSHLPKLEELEYITWNRETGDISKGPNWDEIEPLLRLLRDHGSELPEDWL
jgi:hypothetical protein